MDPTSEAAAGESIALELTLSAAGSPPPAMRAEEYVRVLQEEEKAIEALRPELPLCKRLLADAIEDLKRKTKDEEKVEGCSGWKRSSGLRIFGKLVVADGEEEEEEEKEEEEQGGGGRGEGKPQEMEYCKTSYQGSKWIISSPDKKRAKFAEAAEKEFFPGNYGSAIASFGGFFPFAAISEAGEPRFVLPNLNLSAIPGRGGGAWASGSRSKSALLAAGNHQQPPPKKARLCWTAELHRRFLLAIEQLGGEQAATPKRIKDLMKVDGITSDQVRSHLQKYRLSAQKALGSSDTATSTDGGVSGSNDCTGQQSVWQFGFPQPPQVLSAQEMLIPFGDAGDSRQEEDENISD